MLELKYKKRQNKKRIFKKNYMKTEEFLKRILKKVNSENESHKKKIFEN